MKPATTVVAQGTISASDLHPEVSYVANITRDLDTVGTSLDLHNTPGAFSLAALIIIPLLLQTWARPCNIESFNININ